MRGHHLVFQKNIEQKAGADCIRVHRCRQSPKWNRVCIGFRGGRRFTRWFQWPALSLAAHFKVSKRYCDRNCATIKMLHLQRAALPTCDCLAMPAQLLWWLSVRVVKSRLRLPGVPQPSLCSQQSNHYRGCCRFAARAGSFVEATSSNTSQPQSNEHIQGGKLLFGSSQWSPLSTSLDCRRKLNYKKAAVDLVEEASAS